MVYRKKADRLLRWGALVVHALGLYGWWHRFRRRFERTAWYLPLPEVLDVNEALAITTDKDRKVWRRDGAWVLWDLIADPRRWYTRWAYVTGQMGDREQPVQEHCDCDEAAVTLIELLRNLRASERRGVSELIGREGPYLLQVVWRDNSGGLHGHHVCAFLWQRNPVQPMRWWHGGNWGVRGGVMPSAEVERGVDIQALRRLADNVAGAKRGGLIVSAHVCVDPYRLKDWRLVV